MVHLITQISNMAIVGLRIGLPFGNLKSLGQNGFRVKQSFLNLVCPMQVAFISGKSLRDHSVQKPAPFPYKTKRYNFFNALFDKTSKRFDENTKVVVVEGNIAAGKTTFAKALASELEMEYFPEVTMDRVFINDYGHDLRDYRHLIPESCRPYDVKDFYNNPTHPNAINFQNTMYQERFKQYIDALAHVFNTGQGVILERCVYSDFCFLDAMNKYGYISKAAKDLYDEIKKNTICELLRPHLVIYLDVPVNILLERIKKRGHEYEIRNNVPMADYMQTLADIYKYRYLKDISKHAELLIYDWSEFGDIEVVVEDIERIDFDHFDKYDTKMRDWRFYDETEYKEARYKYTRDKLNILKYFNVPNFTVPEMMIPSDDAKSYLEVYKSVPGNRYAKGYNADVGDSNILFKAKRLNPMDP